MITSSTSISTPLENGNQLTFTGKWFGTVPERMIFKFYTYSGGVCTTTRLPASSSGIDCAVTIMNDTSLSCTIFGANATATTPMCLAIQRWDVTNDNANRTSVVFPIGTETPYTRGAFDTVGCTNNCPSIVDTTPWAGTGILNLSLTATPAGCSATYKDKFLVKLAYSTTCGPTLGLSKFIPKCIISAGTDCTAKKIVCAIDFGLAAGDRNYPTNLISTPCPLTVAEVRFMGPSTLVSSSSGTPIKVASLMPRMDAQATSGCGLVQSYRGCYSIAPGNARDLFIGYESGRLLRQNYWEVPRFATRNGTLEECQLQFLPYPCQFNEMVPDTIGPEFILPTIYSATRPAQFLYAAQGLVGTETSPTENMGIVLNYYSFDETYQIDQLGAFDSEGNGFQSTITVKLQNATGFVLAQVVFNAGQDYPLRDGFRWQSITPMNLNQTYVVTATGYSTNERAAYIPGDSGVSAGVAHHHLTM